MRIASLRLRGIRCFEDTGDIRLSPTCNIFVGQNNAGKSTLLKGAMAWQGFPFDYPADARPNNQSVQNELVLTGVSQEDYLRQRPGPQGTIRFVRSWGGPISSQDNIPLQTTSDEAIFAQDWPNNFIVPFVAKRKAQGFDQNVSSGAQRNVSGTFNNLYSHIDRVATPGPSAHELYRNAVEEIVGVLITTRASTNGKEAGYYFDDDNFVTLDRMGDGVSEMVALIVELSLAKNKVFILEEPETNLHPRGLKALLNLVRESSSRNQFLIATHSNVVVRELAASEGTKVFRVYREDETPSSPSSVAEVERNPIAHMELLRELGYEFGDFDLHEAWLFLEEASAETVIREILIPQFAPELEGRLRTFSSAGVTNLEPSVAEFQRLISFVHLQPVYRDRIWVRADGDEAGRKIISSIQTKFPYLNSPRAAAFLKEQFEHYYPSTFSSQSAAVLAIKGKQERRAAKAELVREVVEWTRANDVEARHAWEESASEQIRLLKEISASLA